MGHHQVDWVGPTCRISLHAPKWDWLFNIGVRCCIYRVFMLGAQQMSGGYADKIGQLTTIDSYSCEL